MGKAGVHWLRWAQGDLCENHDHACIEKLDHCVIFQSAAFCWLRNVHVFCCGCLASPWACGRGSPEDLGSVQVAFWLGSSEIFQILRWIHTVGAWATVCYVRCR